MILQQPHLLQNPWLLLHTPRSRSHSQVLLSSSFSNFNSNSILSLPTRFGNTTSTSPLSLPSLRLTGRRFRLLPGCNAAGAGREISDGEESFGDEDGGGVLAVENAEITGEGLLGNQGMWDQMKEIAMFTGPAAGLWICGPLMSLIDTAVIGQRSSLELAALGPATVLCDNLSYLFMFLSIATSNMVATALAKRDKKEVQHHISVLLFVGLTCGFMMLLFTRFFGSWALTAFTGAKNIHLVPAANTYVQVVAAYMMIESLNKKGYNAYSISIPSPKDILTITELAAPVFITLMAKIAFYTLLVYFATSMGTITTAAHQVMIQNCFMCTVWGEPLSQTAQSFMPELIHGVKRNLEKARTLLKSLVVMGGVFGVVLGTFGTCIPWLFPNIYTPDQIIIKEMHTVLIPYFLIVLATPPTHSLEGTLLAGRDLKFISMTMSGCFIVGAILLKLVSVKGFGLAGIWFVLAGFQWARLFIALQRLLSSDGILYSKEKESSTTGQRYFLSSPNFPGKMMIQAHVSFRNPSLLLNHLRPRSQLSSTFFNPNNPHFGNKTTALSLPTLRFHSRRARISPACIAADYDEQNCGGEAAVENVDVLGEGMWEQIKEIAMFTGPAVGLWICGPLMSLIDTVVIGQGSSLELAALGPGTVFCDYLSYVFMFLSIATSNMVATALARRDKNEVQHHISVLLFVGLTCGFLMFFFTRFFGLWSLTAFAGANNVHIVPAANTYVQVVAGYMMVENLNKKGYNAYALSIPSPKELIAILELAAPVFITMTSKVAFYSLLIYFATSMGTISMAAHQVAFFDTWKTSYDSNVLHVHCLG
ncbi:hypothetical protein F8388_024102 [Cannabis sativa]|uniref:Protein DETOXIFICATION n=1 Tax=Cannabis sativa TaxID=3483 RepID=A0A7J6FXG5_CANSA|nr:hypothetical protein F8388_024102 [Cannabis sativa]KAF4383439.1 hypothetical protein G4B88_024013 [Cannabis sativa]